MTDSICFLGPRGWAVLVLAGGATLSVPFVRNADSLPGKPSTSAVLPQHVDFSNTSWPDLHEDSLTPSGRTATHLSEQDWAELAQLRNNSSAAPPKVTGNLPSTRALPAWADRGPRIEQLVNESIRTEPLSPVAPVAAAVLEPLRPWMGHGMKINPESQATVPQVGDLEGRFAIAPLNPDARWTSLPSATANAGSQDSGVLASNQPFRKFEDHIKQWPDEKLSTGQVARETANWPTVSRPSEFPLAGQTSGSLVLPPSNVDYMAKPESLSAPMVSSQSSRPAPRSNPPTIETHKPSTASPRPKHFIQQPAKRA